MVPDVTSSQCWKHPFLSDMICNAGKYAPAIVAITESWLKPYHDDNKVSMDGYNMFRSDRKNRERGGVLLYLKETIPVIAHEIFDDDICQAVCCFCHPLDLLIFCAYKPCDASFSSFTGLLNFFETCMNQTEDLYKYSIIIVGDFNFPELWNVRNENIEAKSQSEKKFVSFLDKYFLHQYVDVSTRDEGSCHNILDLVITNNDRLVLDNKSEKTILSDHKIVDILLSPNQFKSSQEKSMPQELCLTGFQSLDLYKADFTSINHDLSSIDWNTLFNESSLEEFPKILYDTVLECCKKYTPSKELNVDKMFKVGNNRSYRILIRKLKKLQVRLKCIESKVPSSPKAVKIKIEITSIKEQIKINTNQQLDKREKKAIAKIRSNPKHFYAYVKKLYKSKQSIAQLLDDNGELQTDPKHIADILQDQFVSSFSDPNNSNKVIPLPHSSSMDAIFSNFTLTAENIILAIDEINTSSACPNFSIPAPVIKNCKTELATPLLIMWQNSLNCGKVPSYYKKQTIAPVFKKGSRVTRGNYRPISLTAHEIKIFERVLRNKIVTHLESNSLISCSQHGFRKGKSCLSQLLKHYDNILTNLLANEETDTIFLDFAKAFDKVDHQILLQKLKNIGILGNVFTWISNFLMDREQTVAVGGALSYIAKVISGVPQGTVLGPILFVIFANDINCVEHSVIGCFADDTRISKSISISHDSSLLQQDLENVISWANRNNMVMHDDKFVFVNFNIRSHRFTLGHLPFYNDNLHYNVGENELGPETSVKDLGITFTSNLSWSSHVSNITASAKKKAGWVLSSFKDRSRNVMLTLYKSLIRSLLEYSCPLWNGLNLEEVEKIEAVQRNITNKIIVPAHVDNYWKRLSYFNLMSLQRRRERYLIIMMWKITNSKISNDLNISFYSSYRNGICANVPPLQAANSRAQSLYDSSFAVKGPQLWNLVPPAVKQIGNMEQFKMQLDTFLFSIPDQPPVAGYLGQNHNSLLEWMSARIGR